MTEPSQTALRLLALEAKLAEVLKGGGGGDNYGGMEARVAKLEATTGYILASVEDIKKDVREIRASATTDFRILFGALIVATLGLAALMAKGFHWI